MSKKQYICPNCGTTTHKPKIETRGTLALELVLWLLLIIPGFCYTMWRLTTKYKACPTCKAPDIIPTDTPRGQKLLSEQS